jgi:hypothetical protein
MLQYVFISHSKGYENEKNFLTALRGELQLMSLPRSIKAALKDHFQASLFKNVPTITPRQLGLWKQLNEEMIHVCHRSITLPQAGYPSAQPRFLVVSLAGIFLLTQ